MHCQIPQLHSSAQKIALVLGREVAPGARRLPPSSIGLLQACYRDPLDRSRIQKLCERAFGAAVAAHLWRLPTARSWNALAPMIERALASGTLVLVTVASPSSPAAVAVEELPPRAEVPWDAPPPAPVDL